MKIEEFKLKALYTDNKGIIHELFSTEDREMIEEYKKILENNYIFNEILITNIGILTWDWASGEIYLVTDRVEIEIITE